MILAVTFDISIDRFLKTNDYVSQMEKLKYRAMRLLLTSLKSVKYSRHQRLLNFRPSYETIRFRTTESHEKIEIVRGDNSMKRTRLSANIQPVIIQINPDSDDSLLSSDGETELQTVPEVVLNETESSPKSKLNFKALRIPEDETLPGTSDSHINASSKRIKIIQEETKKEEEVLEPNTNPSKGKLRAVVDLHMMKEDLRQLEDPPITPWAKELSSNRLEYDFFNTPCETLAKKLLGKILVRYLENGTVLKGRIVETEGYLGTVDKASHSYKHKLTPRNLPMYMPPGTIYIYMTYGMYHCFNISSQEPNAHVLIRAMEPLLGIEYMELLRNMQPKDNGRQKRIADRAIRLKQYELCNNPSKVCDAFAIDEDIFDGKSAYACSNLWLENQPFVRPPTIVAVAPKNHRDGCAVLVRALDPLEGMEYMMDQRNTSKKDKLKPHELCNGPAKLCMAYQLRKEYSKYSLCTWKGLWIEDDSTPQDIKIVKCPRIGIDSCGTEWATKPLRFYIYGNRSVSKRDKKAEMDVAEDFVPD